MSISKKSMFTTPIARSGNFRQLAENAIAAGRSSFPLILGCAAYATWMAPVPLGLRTQHRVLTSREWLNAEVKLLRQNGENTDLRFYQDEWHRLWQSATANLKSCRSSSRPSLNTAAGNIVIECWGRSCTRPTGRIES